MQIIKTSILWLILSAVASADDRVDYARDVQPILQKHCYACHGPKQQKSSYRLDLRDAALKGGDSGEPAIIPHDAKNSPLYQYVTSADEDTRMPPKDSGQAALSTAEQKVLERWISEGPAWPPELAGASATDTVRWSLAPLVKPPVPEGAQHPIDAFVRAKLAKAAPAGKPITPSQPAERRALIRRLCYDLTGLPPEPAELAAFVADEKPQAYERLVARLLASPRYGEHWARHWLDVANYADTHGNDHDYARPNAWHYRDYVINALNDDKPYTRFVQEQIAGDELFPDDPQATVALGFLAAGPWDHTLMVTVRADTVDHHSAQNLDRDNMVSTTMGTFQSLTVHCARCHNHKFDPISQREYYSLQAVFAGVDRADRPFDTDSSTHATRKQLLAESAVLDKHDSSLDARLDSPPVLTQVAAWETAWTRREASWKQLDIVGVVSTSGSTLTRQEDGSWLAGGNRPKQDSYIITAHRPAGKLSAVRLEVLPDDRLPLKGPGRADNGNFHLTEFRAFVATKAAAESAKQIVFGSAAADYDEGPTFTAAHAIDGNDQTLWGIYPRIAQPHTSVYTVKEPADHPADATFTFVLDFRDGVNGHGIGRFRLATSDEPATVSLEQIPDRLTAILKRPAASRTLAERRELALAVLKAENRAQLAALPAPQMTYAVASDFAPDGANFTPPSGPRPIHVLVRGDLARPGELVGPGTLGCVPQMSSQLAIKDIGNEAQRRAALARWLADPQNALTWRSIVNRVWAYHFGRGLCDTPNDFGKMGAAPSHPELLDWLAIWFRDDAHGSLKALHRLIVTSETWKQSTLAQQGADIDADNHLLWRQNRTRLSGEQVRDTLLAYSGKLDTTMGGPPAVQFISRGDATFNPGGNPAFLDYDHFDPDAPAARRRAIYRFLFRTVPDPFLDALDVPDGGAATPVRSASTTAVQAFAMLNDPFVIRQSEHIAARIKSAESNLVASNTAASAPTLAARQADAAFRLILLRPARETERDQVAAYLERNGLANACQLLLNSNEFLYVD